MNSSIHIDNKGKYILILGKGPTQGLGEHSLTAEKMYSINITKFLLSLLNLHYDGANSYLFVNGTEIYKFKAKDSKIIASKPIKFRKYFKRLGGTYMKKTGFTGYVYDFSVSYNDIDVDNIKDIHKHLMKKNDII